MKRWWMTLLAGALCLLTACGGQSAQGSVSSPPETPASSAQAETPAEPEQPAEPEVTGEPGLTPAEQAILAERRDIAEQYMRAMATVIWRAEESVVYTLQSRTDPQEVKESERLSIEAGRLYRGLPYGYGYSTLETFLTFAEEPSADGIYSVSGLTWQALGGGSQYASIGSDCSGALVGAWGQIGATVPMTSTKNMCEKNGFLKVGEYKSDPNVNADTHLVTMMKNSEQGIYRAYAQLQKADGIVRRKGSSGHARMIVGVDVVYREDGTIDGNGSTVTILEQTSTNLRKGVKYYDATLGEDVYEIYGVDREITFHKLWIDGYLPITCKELVDPSPVPEPEAVYSGAKGDKLTILNGTITANWPIDTVTVIIADGAGKEVQRASVAAARTKVRSFDMQKFVTDVPDVILGHVDPGELPAGTYHCTTVCRLCTGREITVRAFDFTV